MHRRRFSFLISLVFFGAGRTFVDGTLVARKKKQVKNKERPVREAQSSACSTELIIGIDECSCCVIRSRPEVGLWPRIALLRRYKNSLSNKTN